MRQADLARARPARPPPTIAAIDALWCGARKGGSRTSGRLGREQPGDRVDARHLERLVRRRAAAGARAGAARASSCRCPAGRRAGGCGLRQPRARAPAGRVPGRGRRRGPGMQAASSPFAGGSYGAGSRLAPQVRGRLGEVPDRDRLDPGERRLGRRLGSAEQPLDAGPPGALGDREHAADRPHAPVERELADRGVGRPGAPSAPAARRRAPPARSAGRSPEPSLRSAAGARLTVIFGGRPVELRRVMPLRTRCFASAQARSARPTIVKAGAASSTCASTSTRRASSPTSAWVSIRASTLQEKQQACDARRARPGRLRRTRRPGGPCGGSRGGAGGARAGGRRDRGSPGRGRGGR